MIDSVNLFSIEINLFSKLSSFISKRDSIFLFKNFKSSAKESIRLILFFNFSLNNFLLLKNLFSFQFEKFFVLCLLNCLLMKIVYYLTFHLFVYSKFQVFLPKVSPHNLNSLILK